MEQSFYNTVVNISGTSPDIYIMMKYDNTALDSIIPIKIPVAK